MFSLGFFNPLLLWALPLAAVPIIIHLLNRRRFNKVPWAAMEYLLRAMKRNRRRMQMEHWIILLLRTLAVVFLVFLVTRPQLTGGGVLRARVHHIVCLDDSASMAQRIGASTAYKKAVENVEKLAAGLGEANQGDLFTLTVSSQAGKPPLLFARAVGADLKEAVHDKLADHTVGDATLDPGPFLAAAKTWMAEKQKDAGDVHYYLVTDSREHDFVTDGKPAAGVLKHLEEMDPAHAQMTLMLVGAKDTENLGVTAVRRRDRLAMARASVMLEVEVTNFGDENSEAAELSVTIDDTSNVVRPVPPIPPGGRHVVDIEHTFAKAGFHGVVANLVKDGYPVDDTGVLALEVVATSPVLVVDGDPGNTLEDGETFYLSSALDTGGDVLTGITVDAIQKENLATYDLSKVNMLFLANIPAPTEAVVKKLEDFVAGGGGLMMFLGHNVEVRSFNATFYKGGEGLVPLPLTQLKGNVDKPDPAFVADTTHFAIQTNAELLDLILSKMVLVQRYYEMAEEPGQPVSVPIRVKGANGSPLLATKTFRQGGHSLLFGSTANLEWNDLCQSPAYLVLLQEIHKHATRIHSLEAYNLGTRDTLTVRLDPAVYRRDVHVRGTGEQGDEGTYTAADLSPADDPGGKTGGAAKEGSGEIVSVLTIPMSELSGLGLYRMTVTPHRGEAEVRLFARNPPAAEGRMQRLTAEGWKRNYPKEILEDRVTILEGSGPGGPGSDSGEGEIWRLLAIVLLTVLLLETFLAWRFGRR